MWSLALLAVVSVALITWFVRDRHRERLRQEEDAQERAERQARLEEAASAVETQAAFGRTVADRIRSSPVQIPDKLRASVDAVVLELDGVAHDLRRSCTDSPAHRVHVHRRTLLHR